MRTIALVAAKGESERVPRKNIRPFANADLVTIKLAQLAEVRHLDGIVLSSESDEVLERGRKAPCDVMLYKRDPLYSTQQVPMSEVYRHLANKVVADVIVWVPVTNPFVEAEVYDDAILIYKAVGGAEYDCLLSVTELKDYVFYRGKPVNFTPCPWPRSQDLRGLYALNLAICILRRQDMEAWGSLVGGRPYFYLRDDVDFHDIDDMYDFEECEAKYKRLKGLE